MYTPKNMAMTDQQAITAFITQNSFGLLVSSSLNATHIPFVLDATVGEKGVLYGHVSRANSHWQELENQRVLVVFSGAHAYISPTWYDAKPAVPTWNYAAVHCYGVASLLSDTETQDMLDNLVAKYEPKLLQDKQIMPDEYQQKLRQAIVGFKIVIDEIQAKEKLGQHRSMSDQQGVFSGLSASPHADATQLAHYMNQRDIGKGNG
jgi:transcriptional regulator